MRSMNSTIFLLLAVSIKLNWKFHLLPTPQTGSLPYCDGKPGIALSHGINVTGLNTLNMMFETPHTLLISVTPFTVIEKWSAWLAAVGNTPLRAISSFDLVV